MTSVPAGEAFDAEVDALLLQLVDMVKRKQADSLALAYLVETAHHVVQTARERASRVAHAVFSWFGGGG